MNIKTFFSITFLTIVSAGFIAISIGMYFMVKDIHLNEKNKKTGLITFCKKLNKKEKIFNPKGFPIPISINTFAIKLDNEEYFYCIHEPSQDYSKYKKAISLGDEVTIYYRKQTKKLKYNVIQLEKQGEVIVSIEKYKRNNGVIPWLFFGLGLVIAWGSYYTYKKRKVHNT